VAKFANETMLDDALVIVADRRDESLTWLLFRAGAGEAALNGSLLRAAAKLDLDILGFLEKSITHPGIRTRALQTALESRRDEFLPEGLDAIHTILRKLKRGSLSQRWTLLWFRRCDGPTAIVLQLN
jgi:hypothetical protein